MSEQPQSFQELQASLSAAGARWEAADTPLAKLPPDEMRLRLGAEPPPDEASLDQREQEAKATFQSAGVMAAPGAPAHWDWRAVDGKTYVTDVRNQENCGSCVAFGTIATVEAAMRIKGNAPDRAVDLSEAHLFYCHGASDGRNCRTGWWPSRALDAFKTKGVVDEACFRYTAGDQPCAPCADWRNRLTRIKDWRSLKSVGQMKAWLSGQGPLVGCFTVYRDFMSYRSGVYHHVSGERLGGHCICIVGYNDDESCWILKNSWGPEWGDQGFAKIAYGDVGIDYEMWAVEPVEPPEVSSTDLVLEKKLITGIWIIDEGRNAAAYIDGVGWKKIPGTDDAVFAGLLNALIAAKSAKSPCNLKIRDDLIKELYVF